MQGWILRVLACHMYVHAYETCATMTQKYILIGAFGDRVPLQRILPRTLPRTLRRIGPRLQLQDNCPSRLKCIVG